MRLMKETLMRAGSAVMAGIMVLGLAGCQGGTESGGSSAAKNPGAGWEQPGIIGCPSGFDNLDGKLVGGSDTRNCRGI